MLTNLPFELQQHNSWVGAINGTKVPFNCTDFTPASVGDPTTWTDFDLAVNRVITDDTDGIGYVFHDEGIVGIDIDIGFDELGLLSDTAFNIITKCKSYTEYSRSKRGFHIFLKGKLPFDGKNNRKGIEIYQNKRWFICTGNTLKGYDELIENQQAINEILDLYFQDNEEMERVSNLNRFYEPIYRKPDGNTVYIKPEYPKAAEGCRNMSLASLAGLMKNVGYDNLHILKELQRANPVICVPPLPAREVKQIVESISRYKKKGK